MAATAPITEEERPVVLVVDDAPASLGPLCDSLEAAGYTVLVACDGDTALQRLSLVSPDAILLDAVMPGLSGFETCERIKGNPVLAHIPIIFMTGLSDTEHVVEGFACGGVDYVVKPIRVPEVLARLNAHARNARIARLAREAVDVAGLGVLLVDRQNRIAWRSPRATHWLDILAPGSDAKGAAPRLPEALQPACTSAAGLTLTASGGERVLVRRMGASAPGETMLLIEPMAVGTQTPSRLDAAALTPRETEVLSWLAKGKTNRDIGDILGMSPRTVNKHLEHVFEKLGVETRAAAAALAAAHPPRANP